MSLRIKRYLFGVMVVAFSIFSFVTTFNDWYYSNGTFEYHMRCLICSFVILAIGINDLQFQYNVTLDSISTGMSSLVEMVKKSLPNSKIVLVSPTELTENVLKSPIFSTLFDETSIEKSKHLSKIYFEISKKYDCAFIDLNSIAIPSYIDGLHFEPSEHEKIAKIIFEHL